MTIQPGTRLGSYEITSFLGEGGMGRVFRAHDARLKRDVAVKMLPEAFATDPDRIARLRREAQTLASLSHVNIAGIHDLVEIDESTFLVLVPKPQARGRISTNGGAQVRWRADSSELFYVGLDGRLMAVTLRLDPQGTAVEAGAPVPLFRPRIAGGAVRGVYRQQYAVSRDGRQFLINVLAEEAVIPPVTLVLNWKPKG